MADAFVGSASMARLAMRRDRWLVPAWVVGFAVVAGTSASATVGLYPDVASRIQAATAINASGALVALYGRIYDPASLGAVSMIKLTGLGSTVIAVVMLLLVIRHTRAEEESGRLELLGGTRLARAAPLAGALIVTFGASLLIGVLTTAGLVAAGLPAVGSLAFGLGWAATGMAFAAVGAVAAQLTTGARAARGLGVAVIAATYALRALGDLADPGPSWGSWLSPIGWTQQVRAFAGDRWWVLAFPLGLCAVLVPVAFALRARRDLGGGMVPDRPGPAHGSTGTAAALAARLHGRSLLAWSLAFAAYGILFGSVTGSLEDVLTSDAARELFEKLGGGGVLVDTFVGAMLGILGAIAAAYGVSAAERLRAEEAEGHAELLLAAGGTRWRWAAGHYAVALAGSALLMLVVGTTMGLGTALARHDRAQFGRVLAVAAAQIPAAWVLVGLVVAVFGWLPRATAGVWAVLVAFVVLGEFGVLWNAPDWLMDLSPFQHRPRLPVEAGWAAPLVALTLAAAALAAVGFAGWRRRDVPA